MRRFLDRRSRDPADLVRYFAHAVRAWIAEDDEDARHAAQTAAMCAEPEQLGQMRAFLDAPDIDAADLTDEAHSLLKSLSADIGGGDWPTREIVRARRELTQLDPQYARALTNMDPDVFVRRHPHLY